ncbi:MAG: tRNA 2-thiouridine(34) synthase MnmA [Bacteroidales bacterium]
MYKKKVVLGMSGGTDSSMAAILLQEQGYEVIGVTFVFHEGGEHHLQDAKQLADRLGIKHIVHDARELFKEKILRYFVDEYLKGETPVPCVLCNNYLKWPLLAEIADREQVYYIATGHYVQTVADAGRIHITAGTDPNKDQSFFLWGLSPDILSRMLLPLGAMTKTEVRELAAAKGFRQVSVKKDSLGVCFCPGDYRDYLRIQPEAVGIQPGYYVSTDGKILGKHEGYPFYTVGQRRGLGINLNRPTFVKEIIASENKVVLATLEEMYKTVMYLKDVVVNYTDEITNDKSVICKIRYRKQETPCHITLLPGRKAIVTFLEPVNSVAPGQAAAFYSGPILLGGGIIVSAE